MIPATALADLGALLEAARGEFGFGQRAQWADEHGDALLSAAAELARIRAVLDDPATVEAMARASCVDATGRPWGMTGKTTQFFLTRAAAAARQCIRALVGEGHD